jgi:hypothetical protein
MKTILTMSAWETRVVDCFSMTILCKHTQTRHLDYVSKHIHAELGRKHGQRAVYPSFIQGYVSGLCRAHNADMMRNHIEFCYIVDNVMYSVDKHTKHETTRDYCERVNPDTGGAVLCRDDTPRGLFWRDSDKRFF